MTTAFETLRQRIFDIIVSGRGADSSLGPDALQKSIPTGRFRASTDRSPLQDPSYPATTFDRAVHLEWVSDEDDADNNPLTSPQFMLARITISHGIYYGTGVSAFLSAATGETRATVALTPQERGLNDALRIKRALACPDLLRGGTTIDPVPLGCTREGATSLVDLGGGRLLVVTQYALRYQTSNTTSYDPAP